MIEPEVTPLWEELIEFADEIHDLFSEYYIEVDNSKHDQKFDGWEDSFWASTNIRKCHLKTIITDKMWLMHINIFPKDNFNIPILGFDIVATKSKISGSFFDYSPVSDQISSFDVFYKDNVKDLEWSRPRDLPQWATEIFSDHMIACGSLKQGDELDMLKSITMKLLHYYVFNTVNVKSKMESVDSTKDRQNKYCINQKTNRRLHQAIDAMGIPEEKKLRYINNVLFEEI